MAAVQLRSSNVLFNIADALQVVVFKLGHQRAHFLKQTGALKMQVAEIFSLVMASTSLSTRINRKAQFSVL